MMYADIVYYLSDYQGKVIPHKKYREFAVLARYCVSNLIVKIEADKIPNAVKRCSCIVAETLFAYCNENGLSPKNKKQVLALVKNTPQLEKKIQNTVQLLLPQQMKNFSK